MSLLQKYTTAGQHQHPSAGDHGQSDQRDARAKLPGSRQEIPRVQ